MRRPIELLLAEQAELAYSCVLVRNLHKSRKRKVCFPLAAP